MKIEYTLQRIVPWGYYKLLKIFKKKFCLCLELKYLNLNNIQDVYILGFQKVLIKDMADSERFELSVQLPVRILSRDVVSASSPNCPCCSSTFCGVRL